MIRVAIGVAIGIAVASFAAGRVSAKKGTQPEYHK